MMKKIKTKFHVFFLAIGMALMGNSENAAVTDVKAASIEDGFSLDNDASNVLGTERVQSDISWDGTADISWYTDSRSEFTISTAEQLAGLAQLANDGNTFLGKKINLSCDIFLNDETYPYVWTPIAAYVGDDTSNSNVFQGMFCGNGYTIYNMKTSNENNGGMFGHIGENGAVKCVDISQGDLNSGGCIADVNEGMISFCNNRSHTVGEDVSTIGGICNKNSGLVYGCKNFGEVWGGFTGGIVGINSDKLATVSQCSNHGTVGARWQAAGIVYNNGGWLYNCYNRGTMTNEYLGVTSACYLAGIAYGNHGYGVIENCYSAGTFSCTEDVMELGVYGICRDNYGSGMTNCYALPVDGKNNGTAETVSYEEMSDPSFVQKLDQQTHSVLSVWKTDVNKINDGLPVTVADESSFTGQCKIQPEAWILRGEKVIEKDLKDGKYQLEFSCYYNDAPPVVTVGDTDIAEILENNVIYFKKAGTTPIDIHFSETENNSSADYQLILKIIKETTESIAWAEVSLSQDDYTYDDKVMTPSVIIKLNGKTLTPNTDYAVSYSYDIQAGMVTVTVTGIGKYTGTVIKNFPMNANDPETDNSGTGNPGMGNDKTDPDEKPGGNSDQPSGGSSSSRPAEGEKLTDTKTKAVYVVTGSGSAVAYAGTTDKKAATLSIPATVKIGDATYKVMSVEKNALKNNKKLQKVTISGNISNIGASAFQGCTALKTVKMGSKVTAIGDKAFSGCKKLSSLAIGKNVSTIGKSAFQNCAALKKITIPAKVKKIGASAFSGCKKLLGITVKSQKLTEKNVGSKTFSKAGSSNYKKMKVAVPAKKYAAYKMLLKKKGLSGKAKIVKK